MTALTSNELALIAGFLGQLGDRFSNDGCEDYSLPDTPENRQLATAAHAHCKFDVDGLNISRGKIHTQNTMIVAYLADKIRRDG